MAKGAAALGTILGAPTFYFLPIYMLKENLSYLDYAKSGSLMVRKYNKANIVLLASMIFVM